jgi:hypothetical protein
MPFHNAQPISIRLACPPADVATKMTLKVIADLLPEDGGLRRAVEEPDAFSAAEFKSFARIVTLGYHDLCAQPLLIFFEMGRCFLS